VIRDEIKKMKSFNPRKSQWKEKPILCFGQEKIGKEKFIIFIVCLFVLTFVNGKKNSENNMKIYV
jgi:hypothetical protein